MSFFELVSTTPFVLALRGQMRPGKPFECWNLIAKARRPAYATLASATVQGSLGPLLSL